MEENSSDNESEASSFLPPLESISPSPSSDEEETNDENVASADDDAESEGENEGNNKKTDLSNKLDSKNEEKIGEKETSNKSKKDENPPAGMVCQITLDIIDDPVVASDGFSYERAAIAEQIRRAGYGQAARSPMTQQPLSTTLVTNQVLKNQITEWKDQHGIVTTQSTPTPPGTTNNILSCNIFLCTDLDNIPQYMT